MSADQVQFEVDDRVALITLDRPPVNALGEQLREALISTVQRAEKDPDVDGVVLRGSARFFSSGADITEFGVITPRTTVRDVVATLSGSSKPVVAALTGIAYGGGLEVALAAHGRIASRSARLAFPEVRLGLVPGAGGTQAIVRALPAAKALSFVAEGTPWTAERVWETTGQRLLDALTDDDETCLEEAIRLARRMAAGGPLRVLANEDPLPADPTDFDHVAARIRRSSRGADAPLACLELIELAGSGVPFAQGFAREAEAFNRLKGTPQSRAMQHVFFAERRAAQLEDIVDDPNPILPVDRVSVVGAGTMGAGITICFLAAGISATLIDRDEDALRRAEHRIDEHFSAQQAKGRITPAQRTAVLHALTLSSEMTDLSGAEVVIEAVFEDTAVKRAVLAQIASLVSETAVIATNTSTLDIDLLAEAVPPPERFLGMHFFSPAPVMPLVEVIRGRCSSSRALRTVLALAKRIGKTPVVSGVCDGFIGNRMLAKYRDAAIEALWSGSSPADVDTAIESFGFAMGPFRMADLAGNDIGWAVRKRRYAENPEMAHDLISDALCEAGRFGQKAGAGWYDYPDGGREAIPSPEVERLIDGLVAERGHTGRPQTGQEIVDRLLAALVDEGHRVLDEGIAQRASDIDVVYVNGYGFPRHKGGPMYHAAAEEKKE